MKQKRSRDKLIKIRQILTDIEIDCIYPRVNKYDIALLRLDEPVPLFEENPKKSFANPVCLPWNKGPFI